MPADSTWDLNRRLKGYIKNCIFIRNDVTSRIFLFTYVHALRFS